MNNKIRRFNEKLGIPDGIFETSKEIYNHIEEEVRADKGEIVYSNIPKDLNPIRINIKDGNGNIVNIKLRINLVFMESNEVSELESVGGNLEYNYEFTDSPDKLKIPEKIIPVLNIKFDIPNDTYKINDDIMEHIYSDLITHELKHLYDKLTNREIKSKDIINYNTYSSKLKINTLDRLNNYMYYLSNYESLVRSSEVYDRIISNNVSKSNFVDFIKEDETVNRLKKISSFNVDNFYKAIEREIGNLPDIAIKKLYDIDDNLVDAILKYYITFLIKSKKMMFEEDMDIYRKRFKQFNDGEVDEEKIIKTLNDMIPERKYLNNPRKYFKKLERVFKSKSNKVLRKIYKLYDMI